MARVLRLEGEGAVYHVIARGNERKAVFRGDEDRRGYLDLLARYRERFGFRLLALCLMGNHIYLAIERVPGNLSRVMLTSQSSYAQRFNSRRTDGPGIYQVTTGLHAVRWAGCNEAVGKIAPRTRNASRSPRLKSRDALTREGA